MKIGETPTKPFHTMAILGFKTTYHFIQLQVTYILTPFYYKSPSHLIKIYKNISQVEACKISIDIIVYVVSEIYQKILVKYAFDMKILTMIGITLNRGFVLQGCFHLCRKYDKPESVKHFRYFYLDSYQYLIHFYFT